MPDVKVEITCEFEPISAWDILNNWSLDELTELASGSLDALDELGSAAFSKAMRPDDIYTTVDRAELEAYIADRRKRDVPRDVVANSHKDPGDA